MELTPEECAILQACAMGLPPERIAATCALTVSTVQADLRIIQQKLGVGSKLEAVLVALGHGLIPWPATLAPLPLVGQAPSPDGQTAA